MFTPTILACEDAYLSCFTEKTVEAQLDRLTDDTLPDMYAHNLIRLHAGLSEADWHSIVAAELAARAGTTHCRIYANETPPLSLRAQYGDRMELSEDLFFRWAGDCSGWTSRPDVTLRRCTPDMEADYLTLEDETHPNPTTPDFARRRARRFLAGFQAHSTQITLYLAYLGDKPVGQIHLFQEGQTVKLENFAVRSDRQRQGIGTTMMKFILDEAARRRSALTYLVAAEEDTAKDMYLRMGFERLPLTGYALDWLKP